MRTIIAVLKEESGATAIEYGLIAALISIVAITAMALLGSALNNDFSTVARNLSNATSTTITSTPGR